MCLMFAFHLFISPISIEHLHVTGAAPSIHNLIRNKHQTQPLLLRTLQPSGGQISIQYSNSAKCYEGKETVLGKGLLMVFKAPFPFSLVAESLFG